MTSRLNNSHLGHMPDGVQVPRYDRQKTAAGIVHLGVGAFHRAHQAWYTEQVLNRQGGNWAIIGASLRSTGVRDQLNPQDGLYTIVVREGDRENSQIVGAIKNVLVAPEDPRALIEKMSHPDIRVITLTITEKGYLCSPAGKGLLLNHSDIQKDIANFPDSPVTAVGLIAASLVKRRNCRSGGVTLLSCDNLPHNGTILRTVVTDFVQQVDPQLLPWIEDNVTFPCSMVDRIVPASTENDLARLEQRLGCRDEGAVFTEPFSQWVIENDFARGAPDWESVGALYTDDVTPFEDLKLRLLNGSHSLMAYLGFLAGFDYVHQVMADTRFSKLVRLYMDNQIQPTLVVPSGFDIAKYKQQLCKRFANSALNHRLQQIAQDGSQKIGQRWLAAVRDLVAMGNSVEILALAVAGWIRYLSGQRESGERFVVDDPLSETLINTLAEAERPIDVLELGAIFGDLSRVHPDFVTAVCRHFERMKVVGVSQTVEELVNV